VHLLWFPALEKECNVCFIVLSLLFEIVTSSPIQSHQRSYFRHIACSLCEIFSEMFNVYLSVRESAMHASASLKDIKAKRKNTRFLFMRWKVLTTTVANLGQRLGHAKVELCNLAGKELYTPPPHTQTPHTHTAAHTRVRFRCLSRAVNLPASMQNCRVEPLMNRDEKILLCSPSVLVFWLRVTTPLSQFRRMACPVSLRVFDRSIMLGQYRCFKKSFATLNACINVCRLRAQCFQLS
jgi:hypothetical protein